ncbi:MAG: hypothetical protein JW787_07250 [Sedimentisphaerales bacterium]|nr:hypothetical protein [Sedimentisphaerales bacterium]
MDVEAFLLCDCATDQQGKLNILGAFDRLYARKMPAVHPACAVAVRLRFSKFEEGDHAIKINFIDDDGNPAGPVLERTISVNMPEHDNSCIRNIILNIQGLRLNKTGEYRFDFAVDGQQEASLPLKVIEVQERAEQEEL